MRRVTRTTAELMLEKLRRPRPIGLGPRSLRPRLLAAFVQEVQEQRHTLWSANDTAPLKGCALRCCSSQYLEHTGIVVCPLEPRFACSRISSGVRAGLPVTPRRSRVVRCAAPTLVSLCVMEVSVCQSMCNVQQRTLWLESPSQPLSRHAFFQMKGTAALLKKFPSTGPGPGCLAPGSERPRLRWQCLKGLPNRGRGV